MDDEEEMLYGDSNASAAPAKEEIGRSSVGLATSGSEGSSSKAEPTHWCMIIRENGVMEVRRLCNIIRLYTVYSVVKRCMLMLLLHYFLLVLAFI